MKIKVTSFSMVNFSDGYNIALKDGKHGGLYINLPKTSNNFAVKCQQFQRDKSN